MTTTMTMEKKYDHLVGDAQAQQQWAQEETYATDRTSTKPIFNIDTPPPTVSGSLHIGHIFSYTQTDIIARFKRLSGYNVFYPFGFDDNGLPTEKYVEKKHGINAHTLGRSAFIKKCSEESHEVGLIFAALWQKLGISADWSQTYSTISQSSMRISQASFIDLYNKGFVYQKEEPALYCTVCQTTVAQAELDDQETPSQFSNIIFTTVTQQEETPLCGVPTDTALESYEKIRSPHATLVESYVEQLVIGTTRPELLPSCVALFYHPEDDRYTHLKGKYAIVPLFGHVVPILADDTVQQDKGTGLVMCCTFGDKHDIYWFKKHNLPYRQSIGRNGLWNENTGILAGLKAHTARKAVLAALQEQNLITESRAITHTVNVHERCKHEIEYIIIKQWFLNILDHKQAFINRADQIEWHPAFMKARYKDWVENLQWDWCLSRQRYYGIPFPCWHCTSCSHIIMPDISLLPVDPQEIPCPLSACPNCGGSSFTPDTDVMDTWNTSSLTPYICNAIYDKQETYNFAAPLAPMAMRPQAHDIIRTWAFYTIIKTHLHHNTIPWKEIVISGHVLSTAKDKISKSKGNTPTDPDKLLATYPADAIRFWTASGNLGQDVSFSEPQLQQGNRLLTKLWNAFRFLQEHIALAPDVQPSNLGTLNEWVLHNVTCTFSTYQKQLEQHEFSAALAAIETFFWNDFCDNYLELVKDQFFNPDKYDQATLDGTRWTLHHVGLRILQMFAPYTPHITEQLYGLMYRAASNIRSLHITEFAQVQQTHTFAESAQAITAVITLVSALRKLKTEHQLSLKVPLQTLVIGSATSELAAVLQSQEQLIKGVVHAQEIMYATDNSSDSQLKQDGEVWHAVINCEQLFLKKTP